MYHKKGYPVEISRLLSYHIILAVLTAIISHVDSQQTRKQLLRMR